MKRIAITLCILLSALHIAWAQNTLTGTVRDQAGQGLAGASVVIDGTTTGTTTDASGAYTLAYPQPTADARLTVSFIGYITQTVRIDSRTRIDIVLQDDAEQLEEVVVVGYGTMRKSDLTGSVASVKIDENEAAGSSSIDRLLQGRAAGVQVLANNASPDAGVSIRIRGLNSFNSSNDPLYVVDGVIINASSAVPTLFTQGVDTQGSDEQTNGLMGLNPQDIQNIEILKDASATAIYGSQGANGVVLITTKGAQSSRPTIHASVGLDISTNFKKMDMLSFDEYVGYLDVLHKAAPDKLSDSSYNSLMNTIFGHSQNRDQLQVKPIDWQDYSMRLAVSQRYYASISGKAKSTSYKFSLGYNDKEGIIRNSDVEQYTMRLNVKHDISKNLSLGANANFAYINSNLTQGTQVGRIAASASFMRSMLMTRPWTYLDDNTDAENADEYVSGPDKWLKDFVSKRNQYKVTPSLYLDWKILPWLSFKSTFGGDFSGLEMTKFKSMRISRDTGSIAAVAHSDNMMYNFDNLLMFNKQAGLHNISGTLGVSLSDYRNTLQSVEGWNIEQYKSLEESINSARDANMTYSKSRNSLLSFFARAVYSYRNRYVLTATYRFDGSSRFRGANKWSNFPSFAFAWRMNEESWFDVDWIYQAKLRVGWGRVGNQAISNYQTLSNYTNNKVGNHANSAGYDVSIYPENMANPSLCWETTEQWNAGLDIAFWNGRLALTVDLYDKLTRDLLQQKNLAISSGFTTVWMNQGSIRNRGLEISLDATPVDTHDVKWNISGNISFNRNKIRRIGDSASQGRIYLSPGNAVDVNYFYGKPMSSTANTIINIFLEGQPMGLFYAYKTDGIVQEGEVGPGFAEGETLGPGHYKYVDTNGNGYIDVDDRTIVGDPNPDFTYGFNTSLSYKRLSLSLAFTGSQGNDVFNLNNDSEFYTSTPFYNIRRIAYENAWTPENPNTKFPAIGCIEGGDRTRYKDINVEDGSFLRLARVSLNYDIPIKNNKIVKRLNVGISATNLFVISNYSGWDPDINSFGSDILRMGVDFNSYPGARTFSFDMKITF